MHTSVAIRPSRARARARAIKAAAFFRGHVTGNFASIKFAPADAFDNVARAARSALSGAKYGDINDEDMSRARSST